MPAGQPTKYQPKFCDMLIDHMKQGFPFETFGTLINVHRDTLYEWAKVHPEFSDAKKRGRDHALQFWFKIGMGGAMGHESFKNMKGAPWIFTMKNCFGWKDRIEITEDDEVDTMDFDGGGDDEGTKDAG